MGGNGKPGQWEWELPALPGECEYITYSRTSNTQVPVDSQRTSIDVLHNNSKSTISLTLNSEANIFGCDNN